MASVEAAINLVVRGQQRVDRLLQSLDQVERAVEGISNEPIQFDVAAPGRELDALVTRITNANQRINTSLQQSFQRTERSISRPFQTYLRNQEELNRLEERGATNTRAYEQALGRWSRAIDAVTAAQERHTREAERAGTELARNNEQLEEGTRRLQAQARALRIVDNLANSWNDVTVAVSRCNGELEDIPRNLSSGQIRSEIRLFDQLASSVDTNSEAFRKFVIASQSAGQGLGDVARRRVGILAEAFSAAPEARVTPGRTLSSQEVSRTRQEVERLLQLSSGQELARSEAGLSLMIDQLQQIRALIPFVDANYGRLTERITELNDEINRGMGRVRPEAVQRPLGVAVRLGGGEEFRERQRYERAVTEELSKQAGIEERIANARLTSSQRTELQNRLLEANNLLADNQLEASRDISREIDKTRHSYERLNRDRDRGLKLVNTVERKVSDFFASANRLEQISPDMFDSSDLDAFVNRIKTVESLYSDLNEQNKKDLQDWDRKLKAADQLRDRLAKVSSLYAQGRGGPALPPGVRSGVSSPLTSTRRVQSQIASAEMLSERLNQLEIQGVDVTRQRADAQKIINSLRSKDLEISDIKLLRYDEELVRLRAFVGLEKERISTARTAERLTGRGIDRAAALADRWRQKGGPLAAPVDRIVGATSPINAREIAASQLRVGEQILENLVTLEKQRVDISEQRVSIDSIVNNLRRQDLKLSGELLSNNVSEFKSISDFIKLQNTKLSNTRLQGRLEEENRKLEEAWIRSRGPAAAPVDRIAGEASPIDARTIAENIIKSAQIQLRKLTGLEIEGVNVVNERARVEKVISDLSNDQVGLSEKALKNATQQLNLSRFFVQDGNLQLANARKLQRLTTGETAKKPRTPEQLEEQRNRQLQQAYGLRAQINDLDKKAVDIGDLRIQNERIIAELKQKQGRITADNPKLLQNEFAISGASLGALKTEIAGLKSELVEASKATGFGRSLQDFQEALKESRTFFGTENPAQAIDKIVREFNKGDLAATDKDSGAAVAENIVTTFIKKIRAGLPGAKSASQAFAQAGTDAINEEWEINSPSGFVIKWIENIVNTTKTSLASSKSEISAAFADAFDPRELLKSNLSSVQLGDTSALAEKVAGFVSRASSKPSLFRPFARLAGESILSSPAVTEATYRKAYEAGDITRSTLLPVSERRGLRGTPGLPGSGLEAAIVRSAMSRVSATGAFVGPLPGPLGQVVTPPALTGPRLGAPARPTAVDVSVPALVHNAVVTQAQKVTSDTYSMVAKNTFKDFSQRATQIAASSRPNVIEQLKTNAKIIGAQVTSELGQAIGGREIWGELAGVISDSIKASVKGLQGRASTVFDFVAGGLPGQQSLAPSFAEQRKRAIDINRRAATELSAEGGYSARFVNPRGRLSSYSKGVFPVEGMLTTPAAAAISAGQRNLRQEISDLFEDVSSGINAASGGGGAGLPPRPPVGPGGPAGPGGGDDGPGGFGARLGAAEAEGVEALLGLQELKKPSKATTKQLEILSAVLKDVYVNLDPTADNAKKLNAELRRTTARLDEIVASRAPDADPLVRLTRSPRLAQGISEGLIGGAFPLLFGQGAGSAVGGGLGGFAGGFAGGALGFGLSLVGTAVGTAVDTFVNNMKELGKSLKDPTAALTAMETAGLRATPQLQDTVERLQSLGLAAAAQAVVFSELEAQLGKDGAVQVMALTEEQKKLEKTLQELTATLTARLLPAVTGAVALMNDLANGIQFLNGIKPPEWISNAGKAAAPIAAAGLPGLGLLFLPGRGEKAAKEAPAPLPELTPELRRQQELALPKATLEALNVQLDNGAKQFTDQVRAAAREQQDLDLQRRDLIESYERSIGDLRLTIERQVTQERLANAGRENEILATQGEVRLQQLRNANAELTRSLSGNEFGQQLADAVSQFTEQQLSTENEIANRRRNLELELETKRIQTEQYRADIAKQIEQLNLSTAKQVASIQLSVARKNEDYDRKRFQLEKQIAVMNLNVSRIETEQKIAGLDLQVQAITDPALRQSVFNTIDKYRDIIKQRDSQIQKINAAQPPAPISFNVPALGASVSTSGIDKVVAKGAQLARQLESIRTQLNTLVSEGNFNEFNDRLKNLADQGVQALTSEYEDLLAAMSADPTAAADKRIVDAMKAVTEGRGIQGSPLRKELIELVGLYGDLAKQNIELARTYEFLTSRLSSQLDQIEELKEQFNTLTAGNTEYEKTLIALTQRGVNPASEGFSKLIENAKEIDRLNQKIEVVNAFRTAATELTGSMRSLVEQFFELGSASEAVKRVSDELGKKAFGFILDIAFKPVEDAMQKTMFDLADKLGFDIKPESLKQLQEVTTIRNSVQSIERQIGAMTQVSFSAGPAIGGETIANINGQSIAIPGTLSRQDVHENTESLVLRGMITRLQVPYVRQKIDEIMRGMNPNYDSTVAPGAPGPSSLPASQQIYPADPRSNRPGSQPYRVGDRIGPQSSLPFSQMNGIGGPDLAQLKPGVLASDLREKHLESIRTLFGPKLAEEATVESLEAAIGKLRQINVQSVRDFYANKGYSVESFIAEVDAVFDNLYRQNIERIKAAAANGALAPIPITRAATQATAPPAIPITPITPAEAKASSTASSQVANGINNLTDKTAKDAQRLNNVIVPQWTKNLGTAVTGLGMAASAVVSIVGGIGSIKKGGAGNVLSGIGSILTTIGGIGMSAAGFMKPAAGNSMLGVKTGFLANANGNIFDDGKLMRFANGGVLQSPTLFNFEDAGVTKTGQAGEAGVEAVMPLKRTKDGRLGVEADLSIPFENDGQFEAEDGESGESAGTSQGPMVPFLRAGGRTGSMTATQMLQAAAEAGLSVPFMRDSTVAAPDLASLDSPIRFETFQVGQLDVVTREEAEEIGRRAEARGTIKGAALAQKKMQNSPATRRKSGLPI